MPTIPLNLPIDLNRHPGHRTVVPDNNAAPLLVSSSFWLFVKDNEGEGAGEIGTSHVAIMAPIIGGNWVNHDKAVDDVVLCMSANQNKNIPIASLQTTWPSAPCCCCIILHWRR